MTIKLEYLKGSREMSEMSPRLKHIDCRQWNIVTKSHPRYRATLGLAGLKDLGIVRRTK
jgi:hypothetical protein